MNVDTVNVQNRPFYSARTFRNAASEKNSFEKYGFYAWGNEKKTVLNSNYVKFKNPDEAKAFVKKMSISRTVPLRTIGLLQEFCMKTRF